MDKTGNSYKQIVRSTGIFGGSQVAVILIGILRTKVAAVLLGPIGVGLMSLYQSIVDTVRSFSDLGLGFSSVKDMSQAHATGDQARIDRTSSVLKRWIAVTSVLGALITLAFARPISRLAFHDTNHVFPVCLMAMAVFMTTLSAGQRALLQGMRRIGDMARASVYGTLAAFAVSSLLYWFFGEKGIVPSLLVTALLMLAVSAWYAGRLPLKRVALSWKESLHYGKDMISLGCYNMTVGLVSTASMLLIRSLMARWADLETTGLFQSSWTISAMALSAVFSAMAADYFPRLCAVAADRETTTRYVNEQLRVALLLSSSVVVFMLLFSPLVLKLFYSNRFVTAEPLLRWLMVGSFLKVLNWPLGYVALSRGKGRLFMLTELLWHGLFFALVCLLWQPFGLKGAGLAYVMAHAVYTLVLAGVVRRLCGFRLQGRNAGLILLFSALTGLAFVLAEFMEKSALFYALSAALLLLCLSLSLWEINRIWPLSQLSAKLKKRLNPPSHG